VISLVDSNRREYEIRLDGEYTEKEVLRRKLDQMQNKMEGF